VAGITLAQFRALLSDEDVADIEAGGIHLKTFAPTPMYSARSCARAASSLLEEPLEVLGLGGRGPGGVGHHVSSAARGDVPSRCARSSAFISSGIRSGRRMTPFLVGTLSALPSISV
jgi:hypothetical protein